MSGGPILNNLEEVVGITIKAAQVKADNARFEE